MLVKGGQQVTVAKHLFPLLGMRLPHLFFVQQQHPFKYRDLFVVLEAVDDLSLKAFIVHQGVAFALGLGQPGGVSRGSRLGLLLGKGAFLG